MCRKRYFNGCREMPSAEEETEPYCGPRLTNCNRPSPSEAVRPAPLYSNGWAMLRPSPSVEETVQEALDGCRAMPSREERRSLGMARTSPTAIAPRPRGLSDPLLSVLDGHAERIAHKSPPEPRTPVGPRRCGARGNYKARLAALPRQRAGPHGQPRRAGRDSAGQPRAPARPRQRPL